MRDDLRHTGNVLKSGDAATPKPRPQVKVMERSSSVSKQKNAARRTLPPKILGSRSAGVGMDASALAAELKKMQDALVAQITKGQRDLETRITQRLKILEEKVLEEL